MNITKEKASELSCTIKIELQKDDYEAKVNKKIKDYAKQASMPGFRPGKVPVSLISKMYRPSILVEEVNALVSDALSNYIEENKLKMLANPVPNEELQEQLDFDNQENFDFYFDIALAPELDFDLNKKVTVPMYDIEIDDEMVQKYIDDVKRRFGETINPETAELTDLVFGEFTELDEEGNVKDGGINHSSTLVLDTIKLKTIQKKFVGAKVGDVIKFDPMRAIKDEKEVGHMLNIDADKAKELKSEFNFKIESITRRKLAELNEETFKKIYPQDNIASVAELEDRIKQDAKVSFSAETERYFMKACSDKLIEANKFELADDILKRWLLSTNKDNNLTEESLEEQYSDISNSIRWQIIESYLVEKYDINIERDDIYNHLMELFMGNASDVPEAKERAKEFVDKFMSNPDNEKQIRSVSDHLLEKKLTDLFKEKLKVETKTVSYEDFIKEVSQK